LLKKLFWGVSLLLIPLLFLPSIADPLTQAKWLAFYLAGMLAGMALLFQAEIRLPDLNSFRKTKTSKLLFLCCALFVTSLMMNHHALNSLFWLRMLSSLLLVVFFWQVFPNPNWFRTFLIFSILAGSFAVGFENLQYILDPGFDQTKNIFDHPNMSSEFYGFFILCSFISLFIFKRKYSIPLFIFALLNSGWWIWMHMTRSVLLGVFLSILFFVTALLYKRISNRLLFTLGSLTLLIFAVVAIPNLNLIKHSVLEPLTFKKNEGKLWSTKQRWIRWQNTAALIADNPLGVGFQGYGFAYIPYKDHFQVDPEISENGISFSPHNTFLDTASEYGLGLAITLTTLILLLMLRGLRILFLKEPTSTWKGETLVGLSLSSLLVYLLILGLFAFPLENAWSYFLSLLCAAYLLATNFQTSTRPSTLRWKAQISSATLAILVLTGLLFLTKWAERNSVTDSDTNRLACSVFPSEWKVCLNLAQNLIFEQNYDEAQTTLQAVLVRQPHNFVAEKLMVVTLFKKNEKDLACQKLIHFNSHFGPASSLAKAQTDLCP